MSGIGVLVILLFVSSVPAIAVLMWFRYARYPFSVLRFSVSLLAGAVSVFPALMLQSLFVARDGNIFVIAFIEEFSRLLILVMLLFAFYRLRSSGQPKTQTTISAETMAGSAGLIAGLGFAILESAVYGASNPVNALQRTFTTALLHGACGYRVGSSMAIFREHPVQAVFRFLTAVVIHSIYNYMLRIPGFIPSAAAILIALSALVTSVIAIRSGMNSASSNER